MTTMSSRDFNRDVSAAKRAALEGPVMITARGQVSHVLLSISDYRSLKGNSSNWADALRMDEDTDFVPPRMDFEPQIHDL